MIKNYLEALNSLYTANSKVDYKYKCYEELILQEGFLTIPDPLHNTIIKLNKQYCYYNCYASVEASPKQFTYCEGYAIPENVGIPISHAWLLNEEGLIVEPTLKSLAIEYYGIPFESAWLIKHIENRKGKDYSLIEGNYLENFCFLKEGFPSEAIKKVK